MAFTRTAIPDFATNNPIYANAVVTAYLADDDGIETATLATLYEDPTGPKTLLNPQSLTNSGRFQRPVYIDDNVVLFVAGNGFVAHKVGLIQRNEAGSFLSESFIATPGQTQHTLERECFTEGGIRVNIQGVGQEPVQAYTVSTTDHLTLTFTSPFIGGEDVFIVHQATPSNLRIPGAGTVTGDIITNNAADQSAIAGKIAAVSFVDNIAGLRTIAGVHGIRKRVHVRGYYEPLDGGGGPFDWDSLSNDADDSFLTINPTGHIGAGRWKADIEVPVNVKRAGAKGDGIDPEQVYFQRALNSGYDIYMPVGLYRTTEPIIVPNAGQAMFGPCPAERLPLMGTPMSLSKTHAVIMVDGNFTGVKSGNGAAYSQVYQNFHIVSLVRSSSNTAVGLDLSVGNFAAANTGRKCKVSGVAIWYFQTGLRTAGGDPANTTPSGWAWHFSDVKCWNCQIGFDIEGKQKIGYAAQSLMEHCTALQLDFTWSPNSGNYGVRQIGGDVLYINPRFESNNRNFYLDTGYATMIKPACEGALQACYDVSSDSRLSVLGGYSSVSNLAFAGSCYMLIVHPRTSSPHEFTGDITFQDHEFMDLTWTTGGLTVLTKSICTIRERANVYFYRQTIRGMYDLTDRIYESGAGRYTPRCFELAGGDAQANYYTPVKWLPDRIDLDGQIDGRLTRMGFNSRLSPQALQEQNYYLDQTYPLTGVGYNEFARVTPFVDSSGYIIIEGMGRYNGSDTDMRIDLRFEYRRSGAGTTTLTAGADASGTAATANTVIQVANVGNEIVLSARLASVAGNNGWYSLTVRHFSRLNTVKTT